MDEDSMRQLLARFAALQAGYDDLAAGHQQAADYLARERAAMQDAVRAAFGTAAPAKRKGG